MRCDLLKGHAHRYYMYFDLLLLESGSPFLQYSLSLLAVSIKYYFQVNSRKEGCRLYCEKKLHYGRIDEELSNTSEFGVSFDEVSFLTFTMHLGCSMPLCVFASLVYQTAWQCLGQDNRCYLMADNVRLRTSNLTTKKRYFLELWNVKN